MIHQGFADGESTSGTQAPKGFGGIERLAGEVRPDRSEHGVGAKLALTEQLDDRRVEAGRDRVGHDDGDAQ